MGSLILFWFLSASSRIVHYSYKDTKIWRLTLACHRWISQTSNWELGNPSCDGKTQITWETEDAVSLSGCYCHLTLHSSWGTHLLCGRGITLVADTLLFCEFCTRQRALLMCSWCAWLCSHTYLWSVCQGYFALRSPQLGTCMPLCFIPGPWSAAGKK